MNQEILHSEIHQQLSNWAVSNNVASDRIVQNLLQDFESEENLNIWATMDPFEYLPQPAPTIGERFFSWAKLSANIRNVMVFLPVAITWEAVSKATEAFAKFVESNNATTVNFLEFWQNGYDVLGSEWQISKVATVDFIIVLIVILLTIISNLLGEFANKRSELAEEKISKERSELALVIREFLFTKQTISRLTLNQGIATAIENLVTATENLQKPRKRSIAKKKAK